MAAVEPDVFKEIFSNSLTSYDAKWGIRYALENQGYKFADKSDKFKITTAGAIENSTEYNGAVFWRDALTGNLKNTDSAAGKKALIETLVNKAAEVSSLSTEKKEELKVQLEKVIPEKLSDTSPYILQQELSRNRISVSVDGKPVEKNIFDLTKTSFVSYEAGFMLAKNDFGLFGQPSYWGGPFTYKPSVSANAFVLAKALEFKTSPNIKPETTKDDKNPIAIQKGDTKTDGNPNAPTQPVTTVQPTTLGVIKKDTSAEELAKYSKWLNLVNGYVDKDGKTIAGKEDFVLETDPTKISADINADKDKYWKKFDDAVADFQNGENNEDASDDVTRVDKKLGRETKTYLAIAYGAAAGGKIDEEKVALEELKVLQTDNQAFKFNQSGTTGFLNSKLSTLSSMSVFNSHFIGLGDFKPSDGKTPITLDANADTTNLFASILKPKGPSGTA